MITPLTWSWRALEPSPSLVPEVSQGEKPWYPLGNRGGGSVPAPFPSLTPSWFPLPSHALEGPSPPPSPVYPSPIKDGMPGLRTGALWNPQAEVRDASVEASSSLPAGSLLLLVSLREIPFLKRPYLPGREGSADRELHVGDNSHNS